MRNGDPESTCDAFGRVAHSRGARAERGDFQTPLPLARQLLAALAVQSRAERPASILEPTCGLGAFLRAAHEIWPHAELYGWDANGDYVGAAARELPDRARLRKLDVFDVDWQQELRALPEPLWVVGNPPWVTIAKLGVLNGNNHPPKHNVDQLTGWAAQTGAANFDVSEWLIRTWLRALQGRRFRIAILCKASVARKVLLACVREHLQVCARVYGIDAHQHFNVAVAAVWLVLEPSESPATSPLWAVFSDVSNDAPSSHMGVVDGELIADMEAYAHSRHLTASSPAPWRSGVKHDCAAVMEFDAREGELRDARSEPVRLEAHCIYPLIKSTDLFHDRLSPRRAMLVPQCRPGESTAKLASEAPLTWAYLQRHAVQLQARRSRIYKGQPPFAVFGIGPYSFAPWKVAVSALHKHARFRVVGPVQGRPVMFDDTCYLLPFDTEAEAKAAATFLNGDAAQMFLRARHFADAKRPLTQKVLARLGLPQHRVYEP